MHLIIQKIGLVRPLVTRRWTTFNFLIYNSSSVSFICATKMSSNHSETCQFNSSRNNFYKYLQVFSCCENEHSCVGLPQSIYSPWRCIGDNLFFSCNDAVKECLDDDKCYKLYATASSSCPISMFSPNNF